MPPLHFAPEEEPTNPSVKLRAVESVPPKSLEELVGELMAATAKNTATVRSLAVEVGTLSRELGAHTREAQDRSSKLSEVTKKAATQGSNRLAMLLTALVTVYEISAPALHELARWIGQ